MSDSNDACAGIASGLAPAGVLKVTRAEAKMKSHESSPAEGIRGE